MDASSLDGLFSSIERKDASAAPPDKSTQGESDPKDQSAHDSAPPRGESPRENAPIQPPGVAGAHDDRAAIRELFGPTKKTAREREDDPADWPGHNYNEAYQNLTRNRIRRRAPRARNETAIWDIQELLKDDPTEPPIGPVAPTPATLPPWPHRPPLERGTTGHGDTADRARHIAIDKTGDWLDALAADTEPAAPTEARLVRTLRGESDPMRAPVFDMSETLHAGRASTPARATRTSNTHTPAAPRSTRTPSNLRSLAFKTATMAIGLKIGLVIGYAAATFI